ncbi:CpsB/CapC family capsule biosynthesis tyrosine phosphatase [uncultured Clostridium sp.]|jgi:protein-tyrosine phosphatase|uniref:tyrosine-protein phosphatase n=1 Tax=uncultured Clostridium sp. TaxID=59620 RepID=UPI00260BC4B2|nr:CpsB/CapC family capsule biosynthesis tyrosine phosphatase [uncultured Clostridium sp.]
MIDIHSHIIPGIDDGAKDKKTSIEMLRMAEENGTSKIVLTPHYYRGKFTIARNEVLKCAEEVKKYVKENNINIDIYVGQEVYFTKSILEYLESGEIGTINNSRYMLIEFDMVHIDKDIIDTLYELKVRGIVPIIAHPERYIEFQKKPEMINKFIEEGYLFQINVGSIVGGFGKEAKILAEKFLKNGIYNFFGSDAHGMGRRTSDISKYKIELEKVRPNFIKEGTKNAQDMLDNKVVKFYGRKIEIKKKKFIFF